MLINGNADENLLKSLEGDPKYQEGLAKVRKNKYTKEIGVKVPGHFGSSGGDKIIVVVCRDPDNSIQSLLEYIKANSDGGHSFSIEVDPHDSERKKTFGMDGDGSDHIYEIGSE